MGVEKSFVQRKFMAMLPREELDRIDTKILDQYYQPAAEETR